MAQLHAEYGQQIEEARRDLHHLLSQNKQLAPTVLRLAFHDAGTYDARTKKGGPNGSIRNELNNPPNGGIKIALDFCEQVKQRHPGITYADLYQLAGVVAVEVTGGPKINFVHGRRDALQQEDRGSLPNPGGDTRHLRDIFHRMGFSDKDIVVLSGAHTLGRAHRQVAGFDGPFTRQPLKFDNSYFVELMKGDSPGLVKFPTDKALLQDPVFLQFVRLYARDERAFFKDYAESHKKMSELGFHPHRPVSHAKPHPQPHAQPHPHPHHHQPHPHQHHQSHNQHAHPQHHHQNLKAQPRQCPPPACPAYGYSAHA